MSATVLIESCVRSLSVKSECSKCKDICDYEAISFDNYFVRIDALACTDCSMCAAVCPSGAITVANTGLLALSADELFCVAAKSSDDIVIDLPERLEKDYIRMSEEVTLLLTYFGIDTKIKLNITKEINEKPEDASKRALFKMFTKDGVKAAHDNVKSEEDRSLTIDYALLKSKKIPAKREFFLDLLSGLELMEKDAACELSFASDKYIDDSCDNCSLCYNLCPSGALEVTGMGNAIVFSPHLCLKCHLCEDVCETKSISSMPTFPIVAFKDKQKKLLKKFVVKLCESCGAVFNGDTDECPRCSMESEDAMELLGLK